MGTKHRMLQRGRPHRSECQTSRCWLQVCLQAGRESWCSSPTCSLTNPDRDNIRSWILNAKKKRTKNNGRIGCPNETINVCDCIFLVFSLMPCFFFFKACFIRVRVGLFFASCVPFCDCYMLSLSVFKIVRDWEAEAIFWAAWSDLLSLLPYYSESFT